MQIIELAAKLQSVGFSDKQAKVYVAALFLGPSAVQKIAEQAEINRATAYVILDELAQMGLVSESTQGKKTVFVAEPPVAIERYLQTQSQAIAQKQSELKNLLPGLKEVSRATDGDDAPVVRFYKSADAALNMFEHYRRKTKPNSLTYGMANIDEVKKMFPEIIEGNSKKRLRKKISSKLIYSYSDGEIRTDRSLLRETRKVDFPIKADINLYEDAATISTYNGKNSVGIAIESKEIIGLLRQLFEMAWDNQK